MLAGPRLRSTRSDGRARTAALAPIMIGAVLGIGLVVTTVSPARAAVVRGETAEIEWAPAPGAVAHYGVWVLSEGEATSSQPDFTVPDPRATLDVGFGETVTIRVAAFYESGDQGPFSPDSDPIRFLPATPAPYDFDGDGDVDVVLRSNRTGERRGLAIEDRGPVANRRMPEMPRNAEWRISGSADFDDDGKADLLFNHLETGTAALWFMNGLYARDRVVIASLGKNWYARALGDREPDGAVRVLWRDGESGESMLWLLRKEKVEAQFALLPMEPRWQVWANCDLDGNGYRDVVWVDDREYEARIWLMDSEDSVDELALAHPGAGYELQACADFDRKHRDTLVWQRENELELWGMDRIEGDEAIGITRSMPVPRRNIVAQAGDCDADGDADLTLFDPTVGLLKTRVLEADVVEGDFAVQFDRDHFWQVASW